MLVQDKNSKEIKAHLFNHEKALLKIPNLAIHLTTERDKFVFNNESHLKPIISQAIYDQINDGKENNDFLKNHNS